MVTATAWPEPAGYKYVVNESNFNLLKASIEPYMNTPHQIGWVLAVSGILFMVPLYIYIKSQNALAAAFAQIVMTSFLLFYNMTSGYQILPPLLGGISYISSIILIALHFTVLYQQK